MTVDDELPARCDLRVISDYEDALEVARDPGAPAAQTEAIEERIAAGRLRIDGDPSAVPEALAGLDIHRKLSARTA